MRPRLPDVRRDLRSTPPNRQGRLQNRMRAYPNLGASTRALYLQQRRERDQRKYELIPFELSSFQSIQMTPAYKFDPSPHQYPVRRRDDQRYHDARQCPEHPLRRRGWFRHWRLPRQIRLRHLFSQPYGRQDPGLVRVFPCLSLPPIQ